MATWRDGPEFAPTQRPGHFDGPDLPALEIAEPSAADVPRADQLPTGRPGYQSPAAPALDTIASPMGDERDPSRPYPTRRVAVTAFGDEPGPRRAVGEAREVTGPAPFDPTTPMVDMSRTPMAASSGHFSPAGALGNQSGHATGSYPPPASSYPAAANSHAQGSAPAHAYPPPNGSPWFGPGMSAPPPAPTLGDVARATTPAVIISLILAGILVPLSLPLFVVAMFCSTRIRLRQRAVRNTFLSGLAGAIGISLIMLALSLDSFDDWWWAASVLMVISSWVVLIVVMAIQSRALQRGERPDQS